MFFVFLMIFSPKFVSYCLRVRLSGSGNGFGRRQAITCIIGDPNLWHLGSHSQLLTIKASNKKFQQNAWPSLDNAKASANPNILLKAFLVLVTPTPVRLRWSKHWSITILILVAISNADIRATKVTLNNWLPLKIDVSVLGHLLAQWWQGTYTYEDDTLMVNDTIRVLAVCDLRFLFANN